MPIDNATNDEHNIQSSRDFQRFCSVIRPKRRRTSSNQAGILIDNGIMDHCRCVVKSCTSLALKFNETAKCWRSAREDHGLPMRRTEEGIPKKVSSLKYHRERKRPRFCERRDAPRSSSNTDQGWPQPSDKGEKGKE